MDGRRIQICNTNSWNGLDKVSEKRYFWNPDFWNLSFSDPTHVIINRDTWIIGARSVGIS